MRSTTITNCQELVKNIKAGSQKLLQSLKEGHNKDLAGAICNASFMLLHNMNDIIDLTLLEEGKFKANKQEVSIQKVVQEVYEVLVS